MPNVRQKEKVRSKSRVYRPDEKEQGVLKHVGDKMEDMVEVRNENYRQFNDRSLRGFIDDSHKRVQGYVPSRESQGKSDDQANVFSQDTRTKLKAIIAGIAGKPPKQKYKATSRGDGKTVDKMRSEVIKNLVQHSRQRRDHNPELEVFWEAWNSAVSGTVIKYDGYLKTKAKRKIIKSMDPETGELEFDEKKVTVDDRMVDVNVPIHEFFIDNIRIKDVQDQSRIAWVSYKDQGSAELELGKYENFRFVKNRESDGEYESETSTFFNNVHSRIDKKEVEIVKYYSLTEDSYIIIANGVLLFEGPMLWGNKDKRYPFSKSIFEPFSDDRFFYGNSLPNVNMDVQDVINALWNMMLDKFAYSIDKPLVSGISNKDLLEQEHEQMGLEHTYYVEDVDQIKELDVRGLTAGEFRLLQMAQSKMDSQTVSKQQQGFAGEGSTAREIVIANEHAKELKGLFFDFLADLWLQKTHNRIINVLQNYTIPQVREIVGDDGSITYKEMFRPVLVEDVEFPSGETGKLEIDIVGSREELPTQDEIDIDEEKMRLQGENFQKIAMTSDYLDNYDYDVKILTESLFNQSKVEEQAKVDDKFAKMAKLFPQEFMMNKPTIFREWLKAYGDDPGKYKVMPPELMMAMQQKKEQRSSKKQG